MADAPAIKSPVGGQAVLEGVMMRGDDLWTVTVRTPDGRLMSRQTFHKAWSRRRRLLGLPLARGPVVLLDSMVIGLKALNFSAEVAVAEERSAKAEPAKAESAGPEPAGPEPANGGPAPADNPQAELSAPEPLESGSAPASSGRRSESASGASVSAGPTAQSGSAGPDGSGPAKAKPALGSLELGLSLAAGLGLAILLFVALPHVLSLLVGRAAGYDERGVLFHLVDGLLKFVILIAYIKGIGFLPEIGRLYAYHGAEHKAIHVFEAQLPLAPESAAGFPTWHPRCGTAFLFLVLALSVLFFSIVVPQVFRFESLGRVQAALAGVGVKILLTLPLSALAYELTRLAAKGRSRIWGLMIWPGLVLQRLTTREPDRSQLEVAFHSLEAVLAASKGRPAPEAPHGH
jgi:uncharacterized protein YqhQ